MNDINMNNIVGKKVLIVGLGKSGVAAAEELYKLGAEISVQDAKERKAISPQVINWLTGKDINCYFGNIPKNMNQFDMVVLSPGVNPELKFIKDAQLNGAEIVGELEIAYRIGSGNYIAITGTNGKTTTTTLVGEIFKASKRKTSVVGNIGIAVISESAHSSADKWLITETSSFQLETIKYFKPVISAILNLTPDHLNRHHTFEKYGEAKANVFLNQDNSNYLVINYDDKECFKLAKGCKAIVVPFSRKEELVFGAFVRNGNIAVRDKQLNYVEFCKVSDLKIIGDHNLENALAAAAICYFAGIDPKIIGKTLKEFAGVEHRIEYCGMVDGIKYYNDSKGTNVDAALTAIKAIPENIVLIAGGDGKGQDFKPFVAGFAPKVKTLIVIGRDGEIIAEDAKKIGFEDIVRAKDMDEAVKKASEIAKEGETVLLSPACASWDMYDNFEQRGQHFKNCVDRLER